MTDRHGETGRWRVAMGASILILALGLAGCGANDSASSDEPEVRPTGSPVKVMVIAPTDNTVFVLPELEVAAKAAARFLNARGGINGHPIDVLYCNDKNDPNLATKCAQQAVTEKVVALVGSASFNMSTTVIPMMEKAKIPVINPQLFGPLEGTSPTVFQTSGTFYAGYSAVGQFLAANQARSVAFIHSTSAASQSTVTNVTKSLKRSGLDMAADVSIPLNSGSVTPAVAQAVNANADAIVVGTNSTVNSQVFPALRQMGVDFSKTIVVSYASTANDLMVKQIGPDVMEDVYALGTYPALSDESMQDYMAAMDREDPDAEVTRLDTSEEAFSATVLVAKVAATIKSEITSASLLKALKKSPAVDIGMGTDAYVPSADGPNADVARLSNNVVYVFQIKDGKFVAGNPERIDDPYTSEP